MPPTTGKIPPNQAIPQSTSTSSSIHPEPKPTDDGCTTEQYEDYIHLRSTPLHYAGRMGANQEFVLDPSDPDAKSVLDRYPDAAPWMSQRAVWSLSGFKQVKLWKAALIEGVGTMSLCYLTIMFNASPSLNIQPLPVPAGPAGIFGTVMFLGPLAGNVANVVLVSLYIFTFGPVTGGHLNPFITFATFFCRLTTFPRLVLYVSFQLAGAALGGLLVRGSFDSVDWKAGGCFFDPHLVTVRQHFTVEFSACLMMIFLAFGVGLDPRQAGTFGPALAPILVGFVVGVVGLSTSFAVPGLGGAGSNPGRCFAVWIGSGKSLGVTAASAEFGYEGPNGNRLWIYWVAPIIAGMVHASFYQLVPPWSTSGTGAVEVKKARTQLDAVGRTSTQV